LRWVKAGPLPDDCNGAGCRRSGPPSIAGHVLPAKRSWQMRKSVLAGLTYFGCVFAVGFALGVVRTVLIVPLLGETVAVAMELPIILAVAWIVSRWLTRRLEVPARLLPRAEMGVTAFILLMAGELSISSLLAGRGLIEHLQLYREASHMLGLAGQIVFPLFPILQIWTARESMSQRALVGRSKEVIGVLAAIALYAVWTLVNRADERLHPSSGRFGCGGHSLLGGRGGCR
jgi:hypothetical protein